MVSGNPDLQNFKSQNTYYYTTYTTYNNIVKVDTEPTVSD